MNEVNGNATLWTVRIFKRRKQNYTGNTAQLATPKLSLQDFNDKPRVLMLGQAETEQAR